MCERVRSICKDDDDDDEIAVNYVLTDLGPKTHRRVGNAVVARGYGIDRWSKCTHALDLEFIFNSFGIVC